MRVKTVVGAATALALLGLPMAAGSFGCGGNDSNGGGFVPAAVPDSGAADTAAQADATSDDADAAAPPDATAFLDATTTTSGDSGNDETAPALEASVDSAAPSPTVCDPTAIPADAACTACGTNPLYACPAAALKVTCIPFDNSIVPDAGTL